MNIIELSELNSINYSINVINALKQYWNTRCEFLCFNSPKPVNMLLYLDGLSAEYTLKDGSSFVVKPGDVVCIPAGSEYRTVFFGKRDDTANTVGINFTMYDEQNLFSVPGDSIRFFSSVGFGAIVKNINRAYELANPCYGEMKSGMYELLTLICRLYRGRSFDKFSVIKKGIDILENNISCDMSIGEISEKCNVSEIYFRKLFKEYSGNSPVEYMIKRRIEKAKIHLKYDNLTVRELSELLGFSDVSYFCKQFRLHTGVSPLKYRGNR